MSKDQKIAVIGGGLVGSLLSLSLAKKGFDVNIFERRQDPRAAGFIGGRSINLALSDRGWKALDRVGVADEVKRMAIPMKGRMIHSVSGELSFQPYGKEGQAIYSVSRGGLNKILLEKADEHSNVAVHFNEKCQDLDLKTNEITFQNQVSRSEQKYSFDRIFGTDGAFSAVRTRMVKQDRFNFEQRYLDHGYKELVIPADENGQHQMDPNSLHIWPRGEYMLIALPNLDGSFTCTLFFPYEGEVSFNSIKTEKDVMDFFYNVFPDAVPLMPTLVEDYFENPTSSLVMISCSPWNVEDRICLLGDASHAIVPFYGQGMNSGFEDCSVFDDVFDLNEGDWDKTFNAFSKKRFPEAEAIKELALRNYIEMRDLTADPSFVLQKKIERKFNSLHPDKWIPLYSQVTFSHIPYDVALKNGQIQDEIMKKVMDRPDIEKVWDSEEIMNRILEEI